MVIIVFGLPGSGKSYFASHLASKINAVYINSDQLRKKIYSQLTYSDHERESVYDEMQTKLLEALKENKTVVLDGTFYKESIQRKFITSPDISHIYFIEVVADEELTADRLKKPRPFSDADFAVYKLMKEQWEPLQVPRLVLRSTDNNLEEMLAEALRYIGKL